MFWIESDLFVIRASSGFNLLPLGLADRNANDTNFAHAQSRESDIISVDGPRDCFVSFFAEKIKWRIQRAKVEASETPTQVFSITSAAN